MAILHFMRPIGLLANAQSAPSITEFTHCTNFTSVLFQSFAFMIFVAAGTYLLVRFKQRHLGLKSHVEKAQKLSILETRPLGNHQHLIVVAYEQQKFLLSVHPNGIRYLCGLTPTNAQKEASINNSIH